MQITERSDSPSVSEATQRLLNESWAKEELKKAGINFRYDINGIATYLDGLSFAEDNA